MWFGLLGLRIPGCVSLIGLHIGALFIRVLLLGATRGFRSLGSRDFGVLGLWALGGLESGVGGFRVQGSGFRVKGVGIRGGGFGISGLGLGFAD